MQVKKSTSQWNINVFLFFLSFTPCLSLCRMKVGTCLCRRRKNLGEFVIYFPFPPPLDDVMFVIGGIVAAPYPVNNGTEGWLFNRGRYQKKFVVREIAAETFSVFFFMMGPSFELALPAIFIFPCKCMWGRMTFLGSSKNTYLLKVFF